MENFDPAMGPTMGFWIGIFIFGLAILFSDIDTEDDD